jgi:hypothetical protein
MTSIIREARFPGMCPITGDKIYPGDSICLYNKVQHEAYASFVSNTLHVSVKVGKTTAERIRGKYVGKWGLTSAVDLLYKQSSYGRVLKPQMSFHNRKFVAGSGIKNCDAYDKSYNNGDDYSSEETDSLPDEDDLEFVVSDDEPIQYYENVDDDSDEDWSDEDDEEDEEEEDKDWGKFE